ncbi:hypothetical protein FB567DRAFT_615949 [Paraphoma chrysanthemicola]|uniref:Uncharacterized protein n=1 Tax=Paraphoma chrysanthemicola TaxID=798071 RepID=A0A8K0VQZ1_9PLEO|nr:hypothetical protein FB567DRAFT_615949 [Paraphoma chrysanthemicola]
MAGQPVQRPFSVTHDSPADLPATVKVDGKDMTFGPYLPARRAAEAYCESVGIIIPFPKRDHKLNIARSKLIAQQYDAMTHIPNDPFVLSAYHALCNETMAQWQFIKQTGLCVEFSPAEQPYPNPCKAILDITQNNHFFVTPTHRAFGTADTIDPDDTNPLLAETSEVISGQTALVNDIFRIVHDFFGHVKEGLGFRAAGEENAWRGHAVMYSPLARRALATELRGQNCWVNWGPHGETNRKARMDDTVFADQKIGLMEEWVAWQGMGDDVDSEVC